MSKCNILIVDSENMIIIENKVKYASFNWKRCELISEK